MTNKKIYLIVTFLIICFYSCGDDSNSTGPDTVIDPDLVQSVGSDGGVLETENVRITIPAGAFSSSAELMLFSGVINEFSENSVSSAFELTGLPNSISKSLRISIKYEGELSEESYMSLGRLNLNPLLEDTTFIYQLVNAEDSSGYLVGQVNPRYLRFTELAKQRLNPGEVVPDPKRLRFVGVRNYKMSNNDERFIISYPKNMEPQVSSLENIFNECFETIYGKLGFSYDGYEGIFPIKVTVKNMDDMFNQFKHAEAGFGGISPDINEQIFYFNINANSLMNNEMASIKQEFGRELMGITLLCYGGLEPKITWATDYYWLCTAIRHWSEEFFTDPAEFVAPRRFAHNEITPFLGMCTGARHQNFSIIRHGRGMSAMVRYLSDDSIYGITGPSKTFESIRSGIFPPTALITSINGLVADWLPGFFLDYVAGDIYDVDASVFLESEYISRTWKIEDEKDTVQVFTSTDLGNYNHLSARMFSVELEYANIDESANLLIDADGVVNDDGIATIVYGIKDDELHFLGETINQDAAVELENLRDYYDNDWRRFFVVVVNSMGEPPYTGDSQIDLTLKIMKPAPTPAYKTCSVGVECLRHYYREHANGTTEDWDNDDVLSTYNFYEGSFNGNIFTAEYEYSNNPPSYKKEGTITVTLNAAQDKVISFTWDEVYTLINNENFKEVISISGENIPLDPDYYGTTAFLIEGTEAVDPITHFTHTRTSDSYDFNLESYEGTTDSRLFIYFRE